MAVELLAQRRADPRAPARGRPRAPRRVRRRAARPPALAVRAPARRPVPLGRARRAAQHRAHRDRRPLRRCASPRARASASTAPSSASSACPISLPEPVLEDAAERLALAWHAVTESGRPRRDRAGPGAGRREPTGAWTLQVRASLRRPRCSGLRMDCHAVIVGERMFVYAPATMEPAVHRIIVIAPQPPTIWQRLETVLVAERQPADHDDPGGGHDHVRVRHRGLHAARAGGGRADDRLRSRRVASLLSPRGLNWLRLTDRVLMTAEAQAGAAGRAGAAGDRRPQGDRRAHQDGARVGRPQGELRVPRRQERSGAPGDEDPPHPRAAAQRRGARGRVADGDRRLRQPRRGRGRARPASRPCTRSSRHPRRRRARARSRSTRRWPRRWSARRVGQTVKLETPRGVRELKIVAIG